MNRHQPYGMNRNKHLLIAAQALYVCCSAIGLTLSGLVGSVLAPGQAWATLPYALLTVGTAVSTWGVSRAMALHGRRPLFVAGSLGGAAGGGLAALAIVHESFVLFCCANILLGVFQACAQYYRFAVAEVVPAHLRSRAIGHVVCAGLVAAVAGPTLASGVRDALSPHTFAGSYLAVFGLAMLSIGVLWGLQLGMPVVVDRTQDRAAVRRLLRLPGYRVAAINAAIGYTVMIFVMTATPLAVVACGSSVASAGLVIQWHLVSMFAPGLFSGKLVAQWGSRRVMQSGAVLFFVGSVTAMTGTSLLVFGVALALNGMAWNFMYVGATDALTQAMEPLSPQDRALGQSMSEFFTFTWVALGSLLAGTVFSAWGWLPVHALVLPVLVLGLLLTMRPEGTQGSAAVT